MLTCMYKQGCFCITPASGPLASSLNCAGTGAGKCSLGRTGYCNPLMQPQTNWLLQRRSLGRTGYSMGSRCQPGPYE